MTAARPPARSRSGTASTPGALGQVAAVLRLRVSALRGGGRRRAVLGTTLVVALLVCAVLAGSVLPRDRVGDFRGLLPTVWTLFAVGAVVATMTGAGGRMLLPRDQAVAFPLSPAADHLGALVLTPLNVSWLLQALFLVGTTSWVVGPSPTAAVAVAMALLWVVAATTVAAALGWVVEIARTTTAGVWAIRATAATAAAGVAALALTGRVIPVLDAVPTTQLVVPTLQVAEGRLAAFWRIGPALVVATALAYVAGVALAAILHRRPQRAQVRTESRRYPRRRDAASDLWAALRIDHAGVWRSAPLRRGLLALGAIPGAAAAATGLEWQMLALLPGLAASGAALLFGVNALCLDGPGALWRETLPGSPRILLLARLAVVTEVCLAGALLALVAAASRAPGLPTPAELAAVGCALLVTTAHVVVACAQWSLDRPYAASLRDPRDQPAPPAAMAGYSARLAVSTTLTGIMFVLLARAEGGVVESAGPALLITTALLYLAWRRLKAVLHRWDVPEIRSDVMATVAGARASV